MSSDFDAAKRYSSFDLRDILEASEAGLLSTPAQGRRARRPKVKKRLSQASMIAPLLAVEGCFTLSSKGGPTANDGIDPPGGPDDGAGSGSGGASDGGASGGAAGGESDGPGTPPPSTLMAEDDGNFSTQSGAGIQIAAEDLLANDTHAPDTTLELVRVFDAVNGTVMLHDGVIHFAPEEGFEGVATFRYEVRDSDGNLSDAVVEIDVAADGGGDSGADGHNGGSEDQPDGTGGHGGHNDGAPHPDDPAKASEHIAALNLAPVEEATHVAVNSGSWFDPATWANGEVPGEGAKVVISHGVEVAYDGESPVSLFTVRVDGALDFATDVDTFMEVDTLLVAPSGRLTIGTAENPVAANVQAVIQIADNGPIDVAWDPMLLSRGVISHGATEIHGAKKDSFLKVALDPMAGDTTLTLENPPEGWQVGDRLVLTGTNLTHSEEVAPTVPRDDQTEDEELIITRIEGNVIHFDRPLQFDHEAPRADLKAYVANYSRNVVFETENGDAVPVHQRGHVMFMHSDDIDVRYAEFTELGRTDKSERAFDAGDIENIQSDSNVKGRYSLHIHRAGVSDIDDPAYLVGNAVWGSPGWGYVHHDSNAVLADNAAYDVYGAAFVAETGNETGRWTHNIAIKSIGNGGGAKWHEDVSAFDLGRTGAGFWFQGRLVDAVDNVAAGVPGGHGFVYMSRGGGVIPVDPATADFSESLRYVDEAIVNYPAITQFYGNEAIAVGIGLEVIKGGSEQAHDVRSVIEDFTGWEVRTGIHLQYTAHYTLRDIDLIATDQSSGARAPWRGIEFGPNSIDNTINGAAISGFPTGVYASKQETNLNHPFDGDWGYVFIDVNVDGADTDFGNLSAGAGDLFLTADQLVTGRLLFDSDIDNIPVTPLPGAGNFLDLTGTKTDSVGAAIVSPTWDPNRHDYFTIRNALEEEGYWTLPDGRQVTIIDQYYADRATGEVQKVGVFVEWERNFSDLDVEPEYHGVLDLNSLAPVGRDDFANVGSGEQVDIDVLANDYDPDGDELRIDGLDPANHGIVSVNDDGTVRYIADPGFTGVDTFAYWVEDDHGNFDKTTVTVTVEA